MQGVTRTLNGRRDIFIYSCSARRVSFQMKFKLIDFKKIYHLKHECMNIQYPSPQLTFKSWPYFCVIDREKKSRLINKEE